MKFTDRIMNIEEVLCVLKNQTAFLLKPLFDNNKWNVHGGPLQVNNKLTLADYQVLFKSEGNIKMKENKFYSDILSRKTEVIDTRMIFITAEECCVELQEKLIMNKVYFIF